MKNLSIIITLLSFLLVRTFCSAQGDLQFNKVLSVTNGANLTVPANKVWKIESINFSSTNTLQFPVGSLNLVRCETGGCANTGCTVINRNCYYNNKYMTIGNMDFITPDIVQGHQASATCGSISCPPSNTIPLSASPSALSLNMPIWLEAGKNISINAGSGILVSAIEFNIIP
jgi:hypothetical protein